MILKLINLNIWLGGRDTYNNLMNFLETEKPDILTLQEVLAGEGPELDNYLRSFEKIKEATGLSGIFEPAVLMQFNGKTVPTGNAILSKFPLKKSTLFGCMGNKQLSNRLKSQLTNSMAETCSIVKQIYMELHTTL
ncbi:MAG TPA: endonuclease/exonuclease/phosphatase family protein [Patescibacteria group bacterium]|nr:endonuclease/exonuclease/phosphatase family protein [Patescibacteria group bacterium]